MGFSLCGGSGKRRYLRRSIACRELHRLVGNTTEPPEERAKLKVYWHDACRAFHIGHDGRGAQDREDQDTAGPVGTDISNHEPAR